MSQNRRNWLEKLSAHAFRRIINWWPPFVGAAIKVKYISPDYRSVKVAMPLTWYNRNYIGTHFGGSIFSMTDPFYMLILLKNLGRHYIVWDKASTVVFKKPGRGILHAMFMLSEAEIAEIKTQVDHQGKFVFDKTVDVVDDADDVVASITKTLYVKKKN